MRIGLLIFLSSFKGLLAIGVVAVGGLVGFRICINNGAVSRRIYYIKNVS